MELLSLIGIFIVVVIALFLGRILSVALKVLFYVLLVALALMLIFGFSFQQLLDWATGILFWVF